MSHRASDVGLVIAALVFAALVFGALVFMLVMSPSRMLDARRAQTTKPITIVGAKDSEKDVTGEKNSEVQASPVRSLRVFLPKDQAEKYKRRFRNRLEPLNALYRARHEHSSSIQGQDAAKVILEAEARADNAAKRTNGRPRARSEWDIHVLLWASSTMNAVVDAKRPKGVDDSFVLDALVAHPDAAVRSTDRLPQSLKEVARKLLERSAESSWRSGRSDDRWRLIRAMAEWPRATMSHLTGWTVDYWTNTNRKSVQPARYFHTLVELWRSAEELNGNDRSLASQDVVEAFLRRLGDAADTEAVHEAIAIAAAIELTKQRFETKKFELASGDSKTADEVLSEFASRLNSDNLADALRDVDQVTTKWRAARDGLPAFAQRWVQVRERAGENENRRVRQLLHWRRHPDDAATIPGAVELGHETASRDADQPDVETAYPRSYINWLRDLDLDEEPQVPTQLPTATGPFQGASEELIRRYSVACRHPDLALSYEVLERLHWQGSGFSPQRERPYADFARDIENWSADKNGRDWVRGSAMTPSRDGSSEMVDQRVLLTLLLLGRDGTRPAGVGRSAVSIGTEAPNAFLARAVMSCRVDRPEWHAAVERWARRGRTPQQAANLCGLDMGGKRPEGN